MNKTEAIKIIYENTPMELIYVSHETPDFFEFIGEAGGDTMKYRVYKKTGMVVCK